TELRFDVRPDVANARSGSDDNRVGNALDAVQPADDAFGRGLLILPVHSPSERDPAMPNGCFDRAVGNRAVPLERVGCGVGDSRVGAVGNVADNDVDIIGYGPDESNMAGGTLCPPTFPQPPD